MFNSIQLPIPAFFGHSAGYARAPPPTAVLLGNILPAPLTHKVLLRCLTSKTKLVSFYAVRILVLALQKLSQALSMFREASGSAANSLWDEAARQQFPAVRAFYERVEPVADSLGDLDPRIDYREVDAVAEGLEWTGFHRIEKDLWVPAPDALNADGETPAWQDWQPSIPLPEGVGSARRQGQEAGEARLVPHQRLAMV